MMLKERIEQKQEQTCHHCATASEINVSGFTIHQLKMFNLLVHPIWVFDIVTRTMVWANEAAIGLWNADTLESLLQRSYASDMSESTRSRLEGYQVQFRKGERVKDQWTFYPKGQAKTVAATCSGIQLASGWLGHDQLSMLVEAIPLVTGDVDQENLRGVEMLRHLPMAVCQFDMKGNEMFQNPEAQKMFGQGSHDKDEYETSNSDKDTDTAQETNVRTNQKSRKRKRSNGDGQVVAAEETNDLPQGSSRTTTRKNTREEEECRFLARFADKTLGQSVLQQVKNGEDCSVEALQNTQTGPVWSAIQVRRAKDPVTGKQIILYSARDITETILAKQETEANVQRSEFFAVMAHEIRTPLHQVTGFIDLLDQTNLTVEQSSYVKLLKSSANSLLVVINDVLDYSKLEAGKMKLESIPLEPKSVVQGSLEAVRQQVEEKGLTLSSEYHPGIPFHMLGDPNRLRQVLLNLLQNAVKFTSQGSIHLRLETSSITTQDTVQPVLKVSVSDTGIGISEEQLQRIFVKYQQADASIARSFGGTGLGLSICKQLVESMGGAIGVHSQLGAGATFWFTIPVELPKEALGPELPDSSSSVVECAHPLEKTFKANTINMNHNDSNASSVTKAPASWNVLVAEDNMVNQKLVANMLTRMGHKVTIVNNGKDAVDAVVNNNENSFDAILMDIQMPVMDGIEATKRLRNHGYTNLPILALTACVSRNDFHDIGFDDWIGKPILMKELCTKMHRSIEEPKLKQ